MNKGERERERERGLSIMAPTDSFSRASFRRSPRRYDTPELGHAKARLEFSPLLRTTKQTNKGNRNANRSNNDKENILDTPGGGIENNTGVLSFDQVSDSMESFNPNESRQQNNTKNTSSGKKSDQKAHDNEPAMLSELPLKEQEKAFQAQKNEIFGLQFKIYLLEQHLDKTSPENIQKTIKENVDLKAELMQLRQELQKRESDNTNTSDLEERLRTLRMDKEDIEYQNRRKDEEIEELKAQLEEAANNNNNDNSKTNHDDDLEDLRYEMRQQEREKDGEIEDLKEKIHRLEEDNANNDDNDNDTNEHVEELKRELKKITGVKDSLETELEEKQNDAYQAKVDLDSLKTQLKEYESTFGKQQERIDELLEERKQSQSQTQREVSRTIEDKQFDFDQEKRNLEWQVKAKNEQLESLQNARDELSNELNSTKQELLDKTNELADVKLLLTRTQNDISGITSEKHDLERQLDDFRANYEQLRESSRLYAQSNPNDAEQVERLRGELDSLRNQLSTKQTNWDQEKTRLEDKISSLERMKDSYETQLSNILSDDKSKENLQQAVESERNKHMEMKRGLEQEISQLQTQINTLKTEVDNYQQQVKEMNIKVQEMDDDLVVSQSQVEEAERQKNNALTQIEGLKTSLKSQENTLNAMRDINQRESQTRKESQDRLQTTELRERDLINQCENLKSQISQLEFERDSLQEKYDYDITKKLETATTTAEETRKKLQQAESERDKLLANSTTPKKATTTARGDKEYRQLIHQINSLKRKEQLSRYDVEHYKDQSERLKRKLKETTELQQQQMKKLITQMRYLKETITRQTAYRFDLGFMKSFFLKQISMYQAFNRADLTILQDMGIYPNYQKTKKKLRPKQKFQHVALAVLAGIRIKTRHEKYVDHCKKRAILLKK